MKIQEILYTSSLSNMLCKTERSIPNGHPVEYKSYIDTIFFWYFPQKIAIIKTWENYKSRQTHEEKKESK